MTWSGFRPSDDASQYGFPIPANMYAYAGLARALELNKQVRARVQLVPACCACGLWPFRGGQAPATEAPDAGATSWREFQCCCCCCVCVCVRGVQVWQMPEFEAKVTRLMAEIKSGAGGAGQRRAAA